MLIVIVWFSYTIPIEGDALSKQKQKTQEKTQIPQMTIFSIKCGIK